MSNSDKDKLGVAIVAVHIITESCDHYNFLLLVDSISDFVNQIKDNMGEELAHISSYYITTNVSESDKILENTLGDLQDKAHAEYERKWQEENS